jgi:gentisate 1,2-dioxygenase
MVWFDGLDLPLVSFLDANFFEPAGADYLDARRDTPTQSRSAALYGHPGLLPSVPPETGRHSPLLVYRWQHTERALQELADATGSAEAELRFVDPVTGQDALPTIRCAMRQLAPGIRTPTRRAVGSSIIVVFSGHGTTVIDGTSFSWGPGDTLALPSWCAVDHQASETARLFVVSDAPVIEALRLDRTETLGGHQPVAGTWSGAA